MEHDFIKYEIIDESGESEIINRIINNNYYLKLICSNKSLQKFLDQLNVNNFYESIQSLNITDMEATFDTKFPNLRFFRTNTRYTNNIDRFIRLNTSIIKLCLDNVEVINKDFIEILYLDLNLIYLNMNLNSNKAYNITMQNIFTNIKKFSSLSDLILGSVIIAYLTYECLDDISVIKMLRKLIFPKARIRLIENPKYFKVL